MMVRDECLHANMDTLLCCCKDCGKSLLTIMEENRQQFRMCKPKVKDLGDGVFEITYQVEVLPEPDCQIHSTEPPA